MKVPSHVYTLYYATHVDLAFSFIIIVVTLQAMESASFPTPPTTYGVYECVLHYVVAYVSFTYWIKAKIIVFYCVSMYTSFVTEL